MGDETNAHWCEVESQNRLREREEYERREVNTRIKVEA